LGLQALTLLVPPLQGFLRLTPLTLLDLAVTGGSVLLAYLINHGKKELAGKCIRER